MKSEAVLDFITILVAGVMNGSFAVPMKVEPALGVGKHLACVVSHRLGFVPLIDGFLNHSSLLISVWTK